MPRTTSPRASSPADGGALRVGPVAVAAGSTAAAHADELVRSAYEEHRGAIYGFLVSATRDGETAAELLQETFLRLLRVARAGQAPLEMRPWLIRVAGNLAISAGRRQRTVRKFASWLVRRDPGSSPEQEFLAREAADRVTGQLAALRPDDRVALLMAANGCTTQEIGAALRRSDLAARSLLCRARMRLRERVASQEVDE